MIIGDRFRELRQQKKLSQTDIEKRSGLLRAYLSRVENGHTIPSIETLEKWAKALEVPMYRLFYEGDQPPELSTLRVWKPPGETAWGNSGEDAIFVKKLRRLLRKIDEPNRRIIYQMLAKWLAADRTPPVKAGCFDFFSAPPCRLSISPLAARESHREVQARPRRLPAQTCASR